MIEICEWSNDASKGLQKAADGCIAEYQREIETGKATLWQCSGDLRGYLVTRLELIDDERELVIVAFEGAGCLKLFDYMRELAGLLNCQSIRGHIKRSNKALLKLSIRGGFWPDECSSNSSELIIRCTDGITIKK